MVVSFNSALITKTRPVLVCEGWTSGYFVLRSRYLLEKLYLKPIFRLKRNLNPLQWLELIEFSCDSSSMAKIAFIMVPPHPKYIHNHVFLLNYDLPCGGGSLFRSEGLLYFTTKLSDIPKHQRQILTFLVTKVAKSVDQHG